MTKLTLLASLALVSAGTAACTQSSTPQVEALTAAPGACGAVETHVVGIYASPTGEATVAIDRPGQHVLVLSAHEATTWHVDLGAGASLVHVYLTGYHAQTIDGVPDGVDVLTDSFDADGLYACGYESPTSTSAGADGCDTSALMRLAASRVHHEATTFHGCRGASEFTIGYDLTTDSDCAIAADTADAQANWIGGCTASAGDDQPEGCGVAPPN